MPTRAARASWKGSIKKGAGSVTVGSWQAPYSFGSRFEAEDGTNPEELLAAAHAACFAMALSLELGKAGYEPEQISAEARVTIAAVDGGFAIRSSHLVCEAHVPGLDEATFAKLANATKLGCPVSKALAAIEITLDARLTQ